MSETYTTEPEIKYEDMIKCKSVKIIDPLPTVRYKESKVFEDEDGHCIHVFNYEGVANFERFGSNKKDKIFPALIKEFNIKIIDECGQEYPDCF